MRHLDLRLGVTRLCALEKNLQDKHRPVDHADIRLTFVIKRFLEITYLPRREFVIENHYIDNRLPPLWGEELRSIERPVDGRRTLLGRGLYIIVYFRQFALSDVRRRIGLVEALGETLDGHDTMRICQKSKLIQILLRALLRLVRRNQTHQHRMLYVRFNLNHAAKLLLFFDIYKKNRPCGRFFLIL